MYCYSAYNYGNTINNTYYFFYTGWSQILSIKYFEKTPAAHPPGTRPSATGKPKRDGMTCSRSAPDMAPNRYPRRTETGSHSSAPDRTLPGEQEPARS